MCNNNVKAIMKKIYSFLFAATALFAAVSCQKEVAPEVEAPKGEKITFTASTEVETKTALHVYEKGTSTIWVAGDQISVFDANKEGNNRCFAIDELSEDAKTATFSYEGEFVKDQSGMADPTVVALYPYQPKAYCDFFYYDRNYITGINFPAEQTAVAGSFDSKAAFALGLGTMNKKELGFQNLYALLKFTVRDAGVKKVTVKVDGENAFIAGDAKIQMTLNTEKIGGSEPVFESPVLSIVENGSNTITLTCEEGFNTEATYYVAVVPTTFTGLSVFFDENETPVNTTEKTMTLEANKIYNLKDLGSPKQERGLAFEETKYDAILGNEFIAPELKGVTEDVVFSSSDEHVASVNPETGDVTLHDAGLVTIIAKAAESRYYKAGEASYELNVTKPKVKVSRELSFSETSITIKLSDLFSSPKLTGYTDGVVYESNNTNVAVVDSKTGEVNVKGVGQAIITASAEENDDYLAGSASYVLIVEEDPIIQLDRCLSFSESTITITIGDSFTKPELSGFTAGVTYESSNTSVASVDPYTGEVSVNGIGSTKITASAPDTPQYAADNASYTLTVNPDKVRVYVDCSKLSTDVYIYSWTTTDEHHSGEWPGTKMEWDESQSKYFYDFDASLYGQTLNYIINNGKNKSQTGDLNLELLDYTNTTNKVPVLYLKPNSNWKVDNARFAAYFFGNADKWCDMISVEGETGTYAVFWESKYPKVIFCRMNPGATANDWKNKWNQTGDLTIPTDGKNLFTVPNGAWDGSTSSWSTK